MGGDATATAGYEAWVFSKRDGRKIRKTFRQGSEAKSWRGEAVAALSKGWLASASSERRSLYEVLVEFVAGMKPGEVRPRGPQSYKPNTVRSYEARRIGEETRSRLEREGQAVDALFACDEDARDGTSLPGCVKVYLPPPGGPLGFVYRIAKGQDGRLYLDHLAFGVRHLPPGVRGETVYRRAHRRLHG